MAAKKPAKKARKTARDAKSARKSSDVFTAEERAAMREHVRERKAANQTGRESEEPEVLAKIAAMPTADRALGERLHAIIKASAPDLSPRLWYGMPAYSKDGKVVCFFQPAHKFKTRYGTLGFSDQARLDDGRMWPNGFAVTDLTAAEEARIAALVKKAVG